MKEEEKYSIFKSNFAVSVKNDKQKMLLKDIDMVCLFIDLYIYSINIMLTFFV